MTSTSNVSFIKLHRSFCQPMCIGTKTEELPASVHYRIAIGPHVGRKALTLYSVPPMEEAAIDGR
jgi:hypothetical protein